MKKYKTLAGDFDGTLCLSRWPEVGQPKTERIHFLKVRRNKGNKLILWTCRTGQALEVAVKWCERHGSYFDAINDNLQEYIEPYGGNFRKICCDYYIDDKSIYPNSVSEEVLYMDGHNNKAQENLVLRTVREYADINEKTTIAEKSAKNAKSIRDILW